MRGLLSESENRARQLETEVEGAKRASREGLERKAGIRGQFAGNLLQPSPELAAARRIRTELREAHRKAKTYSDALSKLPPNQGLHYETGFRFNTDAWNENAAVLAAHGDVYGAVEAAYDEIGRANTVIGWRATSATGLYGVNREEDDLPAVVAASARNRGAGGTDRARAQPVTQGWGASAR